LVRGVPGVILNDMRPLTDLFVSALGAQMSLASLVLYEAWPKFLDNVIFDDSRLGLGMSRDQANWTFWTLVLVVAIAVALVWRWHRAELAVRVGVSTAVVLIATSYLQFWITYGELASLENFGLVVVDGWMWLWMVLAPLFGGAWWVRELRRPRSSGRPPAAR